MILLVLFTLFNEEHPCIAVTSLAVRVLFAVNVWLLCISMAVRLGVKLAAKMNVDRSVQSQHAQDLGEADVMTYKRIRSYEFREVEVFAQDMNLSSSEVFSKRTAMSSRKWR